MSQEKIKKGEEIKARNTNKENNAKKLKTTVVKQGKCETIFKNGRLFTKGVGPCIAIVAHGEITYLDKNADDKSEKFISLYHSQDEMYSVYCVEFDHVPILKELSKGYIPMLIKCPDDIWVYGLTSDQIPQPQITKLVSQRTDAYAQLPFDKKPKSYAISEDIHKDIGESKAHCHYFIPTGKKNIEEEDNFNYCIETTRSDLIANLFSQIETRISKQNGKLLTINLMEIELIGGQKADAQEGLSGSEMRAIALKKVFEDLYTLSSAIKDDMNVSLDFSRLTVKSNNLLQTHGDASFDITAFFSEKDKNLLVNVVKTEPIPKVFHAPLFSVPLNTLSLNSLSLDLNKNQKRKLSNNEKENKNPKKIKLDLNNDDNSYTTPALFIQLSSFEKFQSLPFHFTSLNKEEKSKQPNFNTKQAEEKVFNKPKL